MTLEAYREIGGVSGALVRRAEELFDGFDREERRATKQVFLRLVTVEEGAADTRRLVPRSELLSLPLDREAIEQAIDAFGRHRLLAFDRDPTTRGPTVEVAHEALLRSWDRLRLWIDDARADLLQHRRLATAAADWEASGRDPGLLREVVGWRSSRRGLPRASSSCRARRRTTWRLGFTNAKRSYRRRSSGAARERTLERRSVVRLRALVAVLTAAVLVAAGLTTIAVTRAREAERLRDDGRRIADRFVARRPSGTTPTSAPSSPSTRCRRASNGETGPLGDGRGAPLVDAGSPASPIRSTTARRRSSPGRWARAGCSTSPSRSSRTPRVP